MCGGGGGSDGRIKDTVAQKKLAQIAAKRFNLYQKHFVPLEQQFMSDVFALRSPGAFQNVEGYVNAITTPEYQNARGQLEQNLFSRSIDPSSGQFQNASAAITEAQQRGSALGTTEALSGQTDRFYQGIQNIVALGEGQAGDVMSGLGDIGTIAAARAQESARTAFTKSTAGQQMLGSAAGIGLGTYMMTGGGGT